MMPLDIDLGAVTTVLLIGVALVVALRLVAADARRRVQRRTRELLTSSTSTRAGAQIEETLARDSEGGLDRPR
jgi:hypothetical protein